MFHIEMTNGKPTVVKGYDPASVTNAYYVESWKTNGASYIQINSNPNFSSYDQAYYSGYIEGVLTANLLSWWLVNNSVLCTGSGCDSPSAEETTFALANLTWIKGQVKANPNDTWFYQCGLIFDQIQGLTDGYMSTSPKDPINTGNPPLTITSEQMYLNTLEASDMDDMACIACDPSSSCFTDGCTYIYSPDPTPVKSSPKIKNGNPLRIKKKKRHPPILTRCSVVVKLLDDYSDLYVGHGTWDDYNAMIKLFRNYNFPFQMNAKDRTIIPCPASTFSGYPGVMVSGDDFYITGQGLVLISSEIGPAPNPQIYVGKGYATDNVRMSSLRLIIGLRLSRNIPELASLMYIQDSGTGNNDWLIVDYKKFIPGQPLPKDTVWYFGSYPQMIKTYDVTSVINDQKYLGLYNIPYDQDLYTYGGWPGSNATDAIQQGIDDGPSGGPPLWTAQQIDDLYSYANNPRALIVATNQSAVKTLDDFKNLVRYNDYTTGCDASDPACLASGPGGANPWNAMLSRGDLAPSNTIEFPADLEVNCFGGIDTKVTNSALVKAMLYWVIMGPVNNTNITPFSFSKADQTVCSLDNYPISQVVDSWDFPWVETAWPVPVPVLPKIKSSVSSKAVYIGLGVAFVVGLCAYFLVKRYMRRGQSVSSVPSGGHIRELIRIGIVVFVVCISVIFLFSLIKIVTRNVRA